MTGTPVPLGDAKTCVLAQGRWSGRPESAIDEEVRGVLRAQAGSTSGKVAALCVNVDWGTRLPVDTMEIRQTIVGDVPRKDGWITQDSMGIKNDGDHGGKELLSLDNLFVESLLTAVTVADMSVVKVMVSGAGPPRVDQVWAIGDNVYVSGLDLSWSNFHIGDLLVMPNVVILNTGYPHSACWKYACRAGDNAKDYINSDAGQLARLRGLKGCVLWPSTCSADGTSTIKVSDHARIVRRGSEEYSQVVQDCRPPFACTSETIAFRNENHEERRVSVSDTAAYIEMMTQAACLAARNNVQMYKKSIPERIMRAWGLVKGGMEISDDAMSGDGTLANVGVRVAGSLQCSECRQRFDTATARDLHFKFIHDPNRHQED